jgi:selenocysteine lyase/cysteine desulfurase
MHQNLFTGNTAVKRGKKLSPESCNEAFRELERGVFAALETYSNVHRGSGHNSMVSTHLYEQARDIVLEYLKLNKSKYIVIFCTCSRAAALTEQLKPGSYRSLSSQEIGLSLGIRALAVARKAIPAGAPLQSGGGTASLISPDWVIWAKAPDKFEAGTPSVISVIAFAKALLIMRHYGNNVFKNLSWEKVSAMDILYKDDLEKYSGQKLLDELRKNLIGRNIIVPTIEGNRPYINLDNAASTPTFMPIWNAVCQTWQQSTQVQQEIIHEVRSICSRILGAPIKDYDLIFTSNTTEAINLAADSLRRESATEIEPIVLNTLLEHTSNELPWRMVRQFSMIKLNVSAEGFLDLIELETILSEYNQKNQHGKKRIKLLAISGASNVLGTFNNLAEIAVIVHKYGAHLLVDAAQMVAHRKIDMELCSIDYLAFSAHKAYAPFGSGMLVARKGLLNFNKQELELIRSSGEENTGGIAAMGKSFVLLQRIGLDLVLEEEQTLTGQILRGLSQIKGIRIYGIKDPSSAMFAHKGGVVVFTMKGKISSSVANELAERFGIGVRYGCHCAHILIKHLLGVGPKLQRFQRILAKLFPNLRFPGVVRVSLGIGNCEQDVDTLIRALGTITEKPSPPKSDVRRQIKNFVSDVSKRVYSLL